MAIQIYNRNKPTFQEIAGNSLGTGLGKALERVVQHKISGMQRGHTQNALQALGLEEPQAQALSWLDKSLLAPIIKERATAGGTGGARNVKEVGTYLDKVKKEAENPLKSFSYLLEMQDLLGSGKLNTGPLSYLPTIAQNEETQRYETALKNFITNEGSTIKGRGSNMIYKLLEGGKAGLINSPGAIKQILDKAVKDPARLKVLSQYVAAEKYADQGKYGSSYHADIAKEANKIYRDALKDPRILMRYITQEEGEESPIDEDISLELQELPNGEYEGQVDVVVDDKGNDLYKVIWKNGQWQRVGNGD